MFIMVVILPLLVMVAGVILFAIMLSVLAPRLSRGCSYADPKLGGTVFQDKSVGTRPSDGQAVGSGMGASKNTRSKNTRK